MKQLKELTLEAAGPAAKYDFFIQWHLTERCNLSCRHCYQSGQAGGADLSLAEIKQVISEISEAMEDWAENYRMDFSPSFNLTGGEPLLRDDLIRIIDAARERGFEIFLLTNGTLIDGQKAKAFARSGIKGAQVSIEGPEEIHDSIRGKGSFIRSMLGVKNLLDAGLIVTLNATLSGINAGRLPEMISLARETGVQRLGFSRLVPSGRGADLLQEMLSPGQVKELYEKLLSLDIEKLDIVTGDPVASQMNIKTVADAACTASGGCAAGISGFTILADGIMTPCRRLPLPLGNVRADSIREIWATSKVLGALRDKKCYTGRCGSCARWANCRGCRAIAHFTAGGPEGYLTEDPQCFIAPSFPPFVL